MIDTNLITELELELKKAEGTGPMSGGKHLVYDDATGLVIKPGVLVKGNPTVGYGRNLLGNGILEQEALAMLDTDIEDVVEDCVKRYTWFGGLDPIRQGVIASCVFNMGAISFTKFQQVHQAMAKGDWSAAAQALLASKAATELPGRYNRYAQILRSGVWVF